MHLTTIPVKLHPHEGRGNVLTVEKGVPEDTILEPLRRKACRLQIFTVLENGFPA